VLGSGNLVDRPVLLTFLTCDSSACYTLEPPGSFWSSKLPRPAHHGSWSGQCLFTVTLETTELRFASRIEVVEEAAQAVADFLTRAGVGEDVAFGIDMAVREAVTNAVLHGNKLDQSKFVDISLKSLPGEFEITVHDQGTGFNPSEIADPTAAENILKTSGRGIFFMRNLMDEVEWTTDPQGGTTVRMMKKI
jgi:serine/threonine-protein kinase RsbW